VRHLATGDEGERGGRGDAEELLEPLARDLLDDGRRRASRDEPGVLVPGGSEPVRGERGRDSAADDEAEVAMTKPK
jgi:hypothetical protein